MVTLERLPQDIIDRHTPNALGRAVQLHASGYRCISRRLGRVSRLDRPDWRDHMAREHTRGFRGTDEVNLAAGLRWVDVLGAQAADHYRRVHSRDRLENLSEEVMKIIRTLSSIAPCDEYQEKAGLM